MKGGLIDCVNDTISRQGHLINSWPDHVNYLMHFSYVHDTLEFKSLICKGCSVLWTCIKNINIWFINTKVWNTQLHVEGCFHVECRKRRQDLSMCRMRALSKLRGFSTHIEVCPFRDTVVLRQLPCTWTHGKYNSTLFIMDFLNNKGAKVPQCSDKNDYNNSLKRIK